MLSLLLAFASPAHAQACICSRNVAMPSGAAVRPWEGTTTLDYTVAQSGQEGSWQGFVPAKDRNENSMADMFMPGHLVQTVSLEAALGLPAGFSFSATLPWMSVTHLGVSEMPGDVDSASLADASAQLRWGRATEDRKTFYGVGLGVTLPTGLVVVDTPVRAGKGAVGGLVSLQVFRKLSPHFGGSLSAGASPTLFTPPDGYRVGSSANAVAGLRFSPRENGRLIFNGMALLRYQGKDTIEEYVYEHTGLVVLDAILGASFNVWAKELRSCTVSLRGEAPLWQVVGDPWLVENFSVTAAVNVVAF